MGIAAILDPNLCPCVMSALIRQCHDREMVGCLCLPREFGSRLLKPCIDLGTESFDHRQLAFIRVADDAAFWARIMRCQQITDDFGGHRGKAAGHDDL